MCQYKFDWKFVNEQCYCECDDVIITTDDPQLKFSVPFECPVCDQKMRQLADTDSFLQFQCCSRCRDRWINSSTENDWNGGWRPNETDIELELSRREPITYLET